MKKRLHDMTHKLPKLYSSAPDLRMFFFENYVIIVLVINKNMQELH